MIKTTKELVNYFRFGAVPIYAIIWEFGLSVFAPVSSMHYSTTSVCSICSNHIKAFLLYLLLQLYPPSGIKSMVSGFKNFFLWTLLHADAMAKGFEKNLDIANLYKFPSEYLASFSQDGDVILSVLFQDQFVIKTLFF